MVVVAGLKAPVGAEAHSRHSLLNPIGDPKDRYLETHSIGWPIDRHHVNETTTRGVTCAN